MSNAKGSQASTKTITAEQAGLQLCLGGQKQLRESPRLHLLLTASTIIVRGCNQYFLLVLKVNMLEVSFVLKIPFSPKEQEVSEIPGAFLQDSSREERGRTGQTDHKETVYLCWKLWLFLSQVTVCNVLLSAV